MISDSILKCIVFENLTIKKYNFLIFYAPCQNVYT